MAAMISVKSVSVIFMSMIYLVTSARILGIVHMPAYSHFQLGDRIFRELASRGHDVTVISPFELKTPVKNLKHVVLTGFIEEIEGMKTGVYEKMAMDIGRRLIFMEMMGLHFTETVLKHPNVQKLLQSNEKFDLVIYENFLNEAFSGFAHHYKVPYILLSTIGASRWTNPKMGNPNNPSYVPDLFLSYSRDMDFWERMFNTFVYVGAELFRNLYTYRKQNQLLQKYFVGAPHLDDLMYNSSLFLLNSHPSTNAPVPLLPNMIEIGGYHVQEPKPLPKELKDYLDNAKHGVIFFSMGSNINSKDMPEQKRNEILTALGKLKEDVLWKWEDDVLPGQPANVKLSKWLPQQDILAHPNLKLFITHGGILSTIEAVYHGVPVVGIPVFGDQELNVRNIQYDGYGFGVPYKQLTEETLSSALSEILNNKQYAETAKRRSKIMQDQPTKPLDRAIYWIEYVIRNQGAPHLKTAALNLRWYQYLLLDVVAVLSLGVILLLWILCKVVKLLCGKKTKAKATVKRGKKQN